MTSGKDGHEFIARCTSGGNSYTIVIIITLVIFIDDCKKEERNDGLEFPDFGIRNDLS